MAPLQHPRTTRRRIRGSRLALPTALVLAAALALSGCGAQQSGAAAIVDGTVISDKDVQSVADQVNKISAGSAAEKLTMSNALLTLILAPYVRAEAERVGKTVAPSQARVAIAKVADPSDATIEFVQMQLALGQLDQASKTAIVDQLNKVKITVNPRYGTYDPKQISLVPITSNWLKAGATSPAK